MNVPMDGHAEAHFFFGVGFESALDPERPFSVLSIPEELTRHSLLQTQEGGDNTNTQISHGVNLLHRPLISIKSAHAKMFACASVCLVLVSLA